MDSFGRMIEIIITVILLFLVPIQYMAIRQDSICQSYVTTETAYFVDSVRNTGFVTKGMYQTFLRKLSGTSQVYEVELNHYRRVIDLTDENYSEYYQGIYTQDIIEGMEELGREGYLFGRGDFFSVKVVNVNKTLGTRMQELFTGRAFPGGEICVVYGGAIRDEIR